MPCLCYLQAWKSKKEHHHAAGKLATSMQAMYSSACMAIVDRDSVAVHDMNAQ